MSTPRQVLKGAYAANILPYGQVWIDMLEHRNLLSHLRALRVILLFLSMTSLERLSMRHSRFRWSRPPLAFDRNWQRWPALTSELASPKVAA